MFTGIVEETGKIERIIPGSGSAKLKVKAETILSDLKTGDSVSTNGVCLTVTELTNDGFTADVMNETLKRSSLGYLKAGSLVNLERAMPVNGRFGGHLVTGHIDGTGRISRMIRDGIAVWYELNAAPPVMRYIVEKGSITIDGISLTVARVTKDGFAVSVIPHTARNTTLLQRKTGDIVNLENDIIGKYIEKLAHAQTGITNESIQKSGFGKGTAYV